MIRGVAIASEGVGLQQVGPTSVKSITRCAHSDRRSKAEKAKKARLNKNWKRGDLREKRFRGMAMRNMW